MHRTRFVPIRSKVRKNWRRRWRLCIPQQRGNPSKSSGGHRSGIANHHRLSVSSSCSARTHVVSSSSSLSSSLSQLVDAAAISGMVDLEKNTTVPSDDLLDQLCRLIFELVNHSRVQQCGRVAQVARIFLGNLPENPSHDLAAASLWQSTCEEDEVGHSKRPHLLAHRGLECSPERIISFYTVLEGHIAEETGAFHLMWEAYDR
mmetsp:Transcript_8077/g.14107  ORF Transcript_8077/g.14107 Transcript_8077/m.14107 type:complete len:204 (-) Transcript_8077:1720-2331(-)